MLVYAEYTIQIHGLRATLEQARDFEQKLRRMVEVLAKVDLPGRYDISDVIVELREKAGH